VSRLCSAGSEAPMRGAGSSHVNLCTASRDHSPATHPGTRRAKKIAHFHPAGSTARRSRSSRLILLTIAIIRRSNSWQSEAFRSSRLETSLDRCPVSADPQHCGESAVKP